MVRIVTGGTLTPPSSCRKHGRMKLRTLLVIWFASCVAAASHAAALPDYIRFTEDPAGARLEVAIRKFTLPSGQRLDLVGAVHIADASYYQEINRRFPSYDSV